MTKRTIVMSAIGGCLAAALALVPAGISARQGGKVSIDGNDIGGAVTSAKGPEAGVWVVAEARGLPIGYRKIVVTDDSGRYVVPDLPKASYDVWVRGYGLVDSQKVQASPGKTLNLTAVMAPSPAAAAEYYPANYWYALLQPPGKEEFPGTGQKGNGISENYKTQMTFLAELTTNGCVVCHQMGTKTTRELPRNLGAFPHSIAAWDRRVQSGQSGSNMSNAVSRLGRKRALEMFADWTDRIAKGELPEVPPRPKGVERNVVVTQWDWGLTPHGFMHDMVLTDKRKPTVNGYGPIYGQPEYSHDPMPVLDLKTLKVTEVMPPFLDPAKPPPFSWPQQVMQPSPYWGDQIIFTPRAAPHSAMMDEKLRVWVTTAVRPPENPDWCKEHPSSRLATIDRSNRHLAVYDPATKAFTPLDTCFGTHHVEWGFDGKLWFSTLGQTLAYFDTKVWDATHDTAKSQGWMPFVLDTNANGRRDEFVEPNAAIDPAKDRRIAGGAYGISPSPVDGTVWTVPNSANPGAIYRVDPATGLSEVYETPYDVPGMANGAGTRGVGVDRNGIVWAGLSTGQMASFDRRKCKAPLNGPKATGQHCPEGWTLHMQPGPRFKGISGNYGGADANYYTFVDKYNTSGLGDNVPFSVGNNSDSIKGLLPDGTDVVLRSPYPLGFHAKHMDGRIDDPKAGWKGRGLWSVFGGQAMWHTEGGKGQLNKVLQFQIRPDPLAK
jgi:hypothetical protein